MVALKIGENQYPLVLTVGALDRLAQRGLTLDNLPEFISPKDKSYGEAVENGLELLAILSEAAWDKAEMEDKAHSDLPDLELARLVLTPGQVLGLCDAAIIEGLTRRVEADYTKNGESAEVESP